MKKVLMIYVLLIACILVWYYGIGKGKREFGDSRVSALTVSKHTPGFNQSLEEVMKNYYEMTEGFAQHDTATVMAGARQLKNALEGLKIDELKQDTAIFETAVTIWGDTKTEIDGMLQDSSLQAQRESLNLFSSELLTLLLTVRYDLAKLYWQECSSAFGDDVAGNWISAAESSKNPYGKDACGSVKKVINFMPADSTKK